MNNSFNLTPGSTDPTNPTDNLEAAGVANLLQGNGLTDHQHPEMDNAANLVIGPDPSLTAPPDDIVYPDEKSEPDLAAFRSSQGIADPIPTPIPTGPILARRTVSGSYAGTASGFRLDLRVDVDRAGKLNMASFDFFTMGSVVSYYGSFILNSPTISYTSTLAVLNGAITGTRTMWANRIRISIPRSTIIQPAGAATVTFFNNTTAGAVYTCTFQSSYFRTVRLETDVEAGTTLLGDYNTGSFTNPSPNRILNVVKAYQEAGINMVYTGNNNVINTNEAGTDSRWTESEMHASMVNHFSVFSNQPQWSVWLFAARRATSNTLLGIMFDYLGSRPHRQGCAVFQDTIQSYHPSANDYNRHLLYTYVHELGHAFNLLHSWDKARPSSLSWMNYDWRYDQLNGAGSYWTNFGFNFDTGELTHMRHGFRSAVIMGGNDWAAGAGLEEPHSHAEVFASEMLENNSGLKLEIAAAKKAYALGEPVVVEIKLRAMDLNGKLVNTNLHPKYEQVKVGIRKPNGHVVTYESVGHNCAIPKLEKLAPENNTAYASAYIGYGKDGFYFDQPGIYKLKAAYLNLDGSILQSEEITIRVKSPLSKAEDEIADLYFTDDAGMLFYLLGSDSPTLRKGMADMKLVSDKYKNNDLSVYAELVLGVNCGMKFKTVDAQTNTVVTRNRDLTESANNLSKVFKASKGDNGIDNITLNWAYRHLAKGFVLEGDTQTAQAVVKEMEDTFKAKNLKPAVQQTIAAQADAVLKVK